MGIYGHSNAELLSDKLKNRLYLKNVSHVTPQGNMEGMAKHIKDLAKQKPKGTIFLLNSLQRGTVHSKEPIVIDHSERKIIHHMGYIVDGSPEMIDTLADWVREVVTFLRAMNHNVFIIPPHPAYFEKCCSRTNHFDASFDCKNYYLKILLFQEYLSRWVPLHPMTNTSCVLLLESLTTHMVKDGIYLKPDGIHWSDSALKTIASQLERNLIPMQTYDLDKIDLNPPAISKEKLISTEVTFTQFLKTINIESLPPFKVPHHLKMSDKLSKGHCGS